MNLEWPKTPRELLEARYKAFVEGNIEYIFNTHHPETRSQVDRNAVENWSKNSRWLGLSIENEDIQNERAALTFTVRYEKDFETVDHRELAEFRKDEGKWFYFDSEFPQPVSLKREGPKVGRNDPCPCGSEKKFKKCCGK